MKKQILFIQGGGDNGYEADKSLVASLEKEIGPDYDIQYPELESDESLPDFGWVQEIHKEIAGMKSDFFLVGHSLGASMILKYLTEETVNKNIKAIFLAATPFWSDNEDWKQGLKLKENFEEKLPNHIPIFFYHTKRRSGSSFFSSYPIQTKNPECCFSRNKNRWTSI
nr:alpha/beta hydrolase [uncultured Flavobacterium sp.]